MDIAVNNSGSYIPSTFESENKQNPILRYPGGKQRHIPLFHQLLPQRCDINGMYIEPFLGGGSVFFHINPKSAVLSDINPDLIELYKGIREFPEMVWEIYDGFPCTKTGYYDVRDQSIDPDDVAYRAARTLFLNRTCFKGMWRQNAQGKFNVGYGGQDRRGVITKERLLEVSEHLLSTDLFCTDFEQIIGNAQEGDFLFLDPPYRPGKKEQVNQHYGFCSFTYEDQRRLSRSLKQATGKGVSWVMTNSSHPAITDLYKEFSRYPLRKGTGNRPGIIMDDPGEVVIFYLQEAN